MITLTLNTLIQVKLTSKGIDHLREKLKTLGMNAREYLINCDSMSDENYIWELRELMSVFAGSQLRDMFENNAIDFLEVP